MHQAQAWSGPTRGTTSARRSRSSGPAGGLERGGGGGAAPDEAFLRGPRGRVSVCEAFPRVRAGLTRRCPVPQVLHPQYLRHRSCQIPSVTASNQPTGTILVMTRLILKALQVLHPRAAVEAGADRGAGGPHIRGRHGAQKGWRYHRLESIYTSPQSDVFADQEDWRSAERGFKRLESLPMRWSRGGCRHVTAASCRRRPRSGLVDGTCCFRASDLLLSCADK